MDNSLSQKMNKLYADLAQGYARFAEGRRQNQKALGPCETSSRRPANGKPLRPLKLDDGKDRRRFDFGTPAQSFQLDQNGRFKHFASKLPNQVTSRTQSSARG